MSTVSELRVLSPCELTFPVSPPGFKGAHRFRLEPLQREGGPNPFGRLVALEPVQLSDGTLSETIRMVVAAPRLLWPDFGVEIDDDTVALLELEDPADAGTLIVVTLGATIETSTANLAAPIVLNTRKLLATQIVPKLDDATKERFRVLLPIAAPTH